MTELDRETHQLLELAREARKPSAADRARVKRRLGALLGAGAVGQLAAGQAEASAGAAASSSAGSSAGAAVSAASTKTLVISAAGSWTLAGVAAFGALIGGYVAVATHLPTSVAPSAAIAPPTQPAASVTAQSSPPPVNAAPELAAGLDERVAPEATPPSRRAPRERARARTDSLTQELTLLHQARAAWQRRDASSALTLLERHRARYPRSELGVEREALRVLSLCELGQVSEARQVAGRLLKLAPASPLRAAVERSCAAE